MHTVHACDKTIIIASNKKCVLTGVIIDFASLGILRFYSFLSAIT